MSLGAYFGFKLTDCPEHVEEQSAGCIVGVNMLIENLEINPFPCEFIGNLA
jgi:hypothetical protein